MILLVLINFITKPRSLGASEPRNLGGQEPKSLGPRNLETSFYIRTLRCRNPAPNEYEPLGA